MALITCPTDCATGGVPDVAFDLCTPQYRFGEVTAILVGQIGQPMVSGDSAEITTRLAAPTGDASKMVLLHGRGDLPAGAGEPNRFSSKYTITAQKDRTLNFTIVDNTEANYEFVRRVDKCGGRFLIWYITADGYMYGGEAFNSGNEVDLTGDEIIPESDKEFRTLQLTANWTAPMSERKLSPLA